MDDDLRLSAYHYSFDATAERSVNVLLSAIAWAGKSFHHTQDWTEDCEPRASAHNGRAPIDWIQNAANDTAAEMAALRARVAELEGAQEEREHDMHMRIRADYDKAVADSWRSEVARLTAERDALRDELDQRRGHMRRGMPKGVSTGEVR